jgi:hypothetical protein
MEMPKMWTRQQLKDTQRQLTSIHSLLQAEADKASEVDEEFSGWMQHVAEQIAEASGYIEGIRDPQRFRLFGG